MRILRLSLHSSCYLLEWCKLRIMRRSFVRELGSRSGVSYPYPISFILCKYMGRMWCAPRFIIWFVMADEIIYRGLSPVGNLNDPNPGGVGVIFCLVLRMTQSPLWVGSQKYTRAIGQPSNIMNRQNFRRYGLLFQWLFLLRLLLLPPLLFLLLLYCSVVQVRYLVFHCCFSFFIFLWLW